jgi:hypothetical protein
MRRRAGAVLVALAACACAASDLGPIFTDFDPIPPKAARLYVYNRDSSDGVQLFLDGHELSWLREKEYATVALPPGTYRLGGDLYRATPLEDPLWRP